MLPREKLEKMGPRSLEDHELMAILLSRGNIRENVFDISKRLTKGFDRLELLHEKNLQNLKDRLNLGIVQTSIIMAAIELGRRFFDTDQQKKYLKSYNDAYELLKNMQYLKKEYVKGLYLNSRNMVIRTEIISIGSLDSNIIHPRELFRPAIEYSAHSLLIAHNHPSGDPSPSTADIEITHKLTRIGNLLQIPLVDHIIVGENRFFSFSEQKLL